MARARYAALLRFEVSAQAREPLTTLYALVFFLLAFGYAASSAVELVSDRGAAPRTSDWALMLAFGGLTAFGQVITTMIATTAMLRDEAQRTRALIATSGVSPRLWFFARVSAAVVLMLAVYVAMPAGVIAGTWVHAIGSGEPGTIGMALTTSLCAYAVITIPTMVVVTCCLATAAVITQRVVGVLIAALGLVAIWQAALTLVAYDATRTVGALLDPFANAPVLALTHGWTDLDKATRGVPLDTLLLANRALWLAIAAALVALVLVRPSRIFAPAPADAVTREGRRARRVVAALAASRTVASSVRRFTAGWISLDGGWRIVSVLAVLNATANALSATRAQHASPTTVLMAVHTHSRIFLVLLATVYAGELVWRERDVRVDQLLNAIGPRPGALYRGRVLGVLQAQLDVIGPLAAAGLLLACTVAPALPALMVQWGIWTLFVLWLPFVQLTVLSLTVHVLLDRKVAAHLLLIAGWVVAVVIDRQGVAPWWVRFAEPVPLAADSTMAETLAQLPAYAQRGTYWSAVGAALLCVCYLRWPSSASASAVTSRR